MGVSLSLPILGRAGSIDVQILTCSSYEKSPKYGAALPPTPEGVSPQLRLSSCWPTLYMAQSLSNFEKPSLYFKILSCLLSYFSLYVLLLVKKRALVNLTTPQPDVSSPFLR